MKSPTRASVSFKFEKLAHDCERHHCEIEFIISSDVNKSEKIKKEEGEPDATCKDEISKSRSEQRKDKLLFEFDLSSCEQRNLI